MTENNTVAAENIDEVNGLEDFFELLELIALDDEKYGAQSKIETLLIEDVGLEAGGELGGRIIAAIMELVAIEVNIALRTLGITEVTAHIGGGLDATKDAQVSESAEVGSDS